MYNLKVITVIDLCMISLQLSIDTENIETMYVAYNMQTNVFLGLIRVCFMHAVLYQILYLYCY